MNGRRNHDTREITMWMRDDKNEDYHYEWECWKIDIKSFSHFFFTASTTPIRWVISFRIFPFTYPFPHTHSIRGVKKNCFINRGENLFISSGLEYLQVRNMQIAHNFNCLFYILYLHFTCLNGFLPLDFFFLSWWLHIFTES